jgi:outer membrane receptor protein involved in Fe transport
MTDNILNNFYSLNFGDKSHSSFSRLSIRGLALACASLSALCTAPALAADASAPAAEDAPEIVVTAQKREESLQKVPISIGVLSGKTLDQQAVGGTIEALALQPSIALSSSDAGGSTQISIRGVAPALALGAGSSTVGYYVDSVPYGSVRNAAVPNTSSFDLSRIEVLRGPQGTLYGANALNGVVRVLTNDPDPSHFEVKMRAGLSATEGGEPSYRADAAINIPLIEDKLAVRLVGGVERAGGWINQPTRGVDNANSQLTEYVRVKVGARPSENLKVDLSAWLYRNKYEAANYSNSSGNQRAQIAFPGTTTFGSYNAKIVYDLPFATISSATSYMAFKMDLNSDFNFGPPVPNVNDPHLPSDYNLVSRLPGSVFTEEFLVNSNGEGPWRWSAGLFYRKAHDDTFHTFPAFAGPFSLNWRDKSKSYAAFGEITRSFADGHLELTGGLRYFHDDVRTITTTASNNLFPPGEVRQKAHATTPRVVMTWLPNSDITAYISYSQGFRSSLPQAPLTHLLNSTIPNTTPDKLTNYEIGSKGKLLGGLLTYDASVYYIKWKGVQQLLSLFDDPDGDGNGVGVGYLANGTSASGLGVDLALTLQPTTGFQIGGSIGYSGLTQDADVKQNLTGVEEVLYPKGSRIPFSPEYTLGGYVSYAFALNDKLDGKFKVSASYRSKTILKTHDNGLQTALCRPEAPGAVILVCESGRPFFVNGNFDISTHNNQTVSLFVENLTNWGGKTDPAYSFPTEYRPRPRTWGIQYSATF